MAERTARMIIRVTPRELEAYRAAAKDAGTSLSTWVRLKIRPRGRPPKSSQKQVEQYQKGWADAMRSIGYGGGEP